MTSEAAVHPRVAVCEMPDGLRPFDSAWMALAAALTARAPTALLLNELPFGAWPAAQPAFDRRRADDVAAEHARARPALDALGCGAVFGSRAIAGRGRLVNEGFARIHGVDHALHHKQCLPEEPGFHEDSWFCPGPNRFGTLNHAGLRLALIVCSELMYPQIAHHYARLGADVLLVPRATGPASFEQWLAIARSTAILTGCYVLSSNRTGRGGGGLPVFGGRGFAVAPGGAVLAVTDQDHPVIGVEIDVAVVRHARERYPFTIRSHLDAQDLAPSGSLAI